MRWNQRRLAYGHLIRHMAALAVTGIAIVLASTHLNAQGTASSDYEALYNELVDLKPASLHATVSNLVIQREAAAFELADGTVQALSSVQGRVPGIVFTGTGRFTFEPPNATEREAVERRTDAPTIDTPIKGVVFLFGDSTWDEISANATFAEGEIDGKAEDYVDDLLDLILEKKYDYFRTGPLVTYLNGVRNEMFCAFVIPESGDPYLFEVTPYQHEQVRLLMKAKRGDRKGDLEIVSQFLAVASRGSIEEVDVREVVAVGDYTIHSTIEGNLDFSAEAKFTVTGKVAGHEWVPFDLFSQLEVDSITLSDGTPVPFFQGNDNSTVWTRFTPALEPGETRVLHYYYEGDLIVEQAGWHYMLSSIGWYPRHGDLRTAVTFDLTFTHPSRLTLVAVGDMIETAPAEGRKTTSHWVTPTPIRYASFNIGRFTEYAVDYPGIPKTVILKQMEGHEALPTRFLTGAGMEQDVARDLANSMMFYQSSYGLPIADHIWGTEIPFGHGQGFPGLLHLSFATFWDRNQDEEVLEVFRAHEVAHQWWGNGVSFRTYRDQWLDEGLADYSALLYLLNIKMNADKFEDILDDYRKEIIKRADEAGPIDLGRRNSTSEEPGDYSTIVYKKGAWVAHMLRGLMTDPGSNDDAAYMAMMQDFYSSHRGGLVSTDDLEAAAEKHLRSGMAWFFDQWVRGTAIPTYEFAHRTEPAADGGFEVHVRVVQRNVPESFLMIVPLAIELDDGSTQWFRIVVRDGVTEGVVPVSSEPKEVTLNAGMGVLAEVKNVKW